MQKKTWIPLGILTLILLSGFFVFQSSAPTEKPASRPEICCKKVTPKCTRTPKKEGPGEMIMETLSRQFISAIAIPR